MEYTIEKVSQIVMRSFNRVWENGTTVITNDIEGTYCEICKECGALCIVEIEKAKVRLPKMHKADCLVGEVEDLLNALKRMLSNN